MQVTCPIEVALRVLLESGNQAGIMVERIRRPTGKRHGGPHDRPLLFELEKGMVPPG